MSAVPPPPEDSQESYPWSAFSGKREERDWENESALKGQETKNHLLFLKFYGFAISLALIVFIVLFLAALLSWAAHYILPDSYHWLNEDQLSKIQSVLFSGSIGSVVSIVAQKHLSK